MFRLRLKLAVLLLAILLFLLPSFALADFWGSKNSNKFHLPSCVHAQRIREQNLVIFKTIDDAVRAKYIPCKVCRPVPNQQSEPPAIPSAKINENQSRGFFLCTRVIDGDTIIVDIEGKQERVRLIGVDTPETVHPQKPVEYFGKEASAFTKTLVSGKRVRLEYDWQRRDKYRRLLAYVFLEDGIFLNAEIIKQGYGFAYTEYPFKHMEDFRQYEREARENGKGLWKGK